MKVLNPKQNVAIDAPTSNSSKFVRCSIVNIFVESWLGSRYLDYKYSIFAVATS